MQTVDFVLNKLGKTFNKCSLPLLTSSGEDQLVQDHQNGKYLCIRAQSWKTFLYHLLTVL